MFGNCQHARAKRARCVDNIWLVRHIHYPIMHGFCVLPKLELVIHLIPLSHTAILIPLSTQSVNDPVYLCGYVDLAKVSGVIDNDVDDGSSVRGIR